MNFISQYFRPLGWAEGMSLLILLFIAMPIKYGFGFPQLVTWVGTIHGGLFLAYIFAAGVLTISQGWPWSRFILAAIASCVPFGPFWFERRFREKRGTDSLSPP